MTAFHRRPVGVTIISILAFIGGGIAILTGSGMFAVATLLAGLLPAEAAASIPFFQIFTISVLAAGLTMTTFAVGLLKMKLWAWWLAVIGGVGGIGFAAYSTFATSTVSMPPNLTVPVRSVESVIPSIILGVIIIGYLLKRRSLFGNVISISRLRLAALGILALLPLIISGLGLAIIAS